MNTLTITALTVLIAGTCFQNESNPGSFKWRNLNIVPPLMSQWAGYEPDMLNRLNGRKHLITSLVRSLQPVVAGETVTMDKWLGRYPERFTPPSRRHTMPSFFDHAAFPEPERIEADKWRPIHPDIIFRSKDRRASYPFFWNWLPDQEDDMSWLMSMPAYIFRPKDPRYRYPSFWNWLPDQPDDDSWVPSMPAYIFRHKDPRYRMPSFFEYQIIPQTQPVPRLSWHGYQPEYLFRLKDRRHLYPSLFRYHDVIFDYCDPQTLWAENPVQTTPWTVGAPQATAWVSQEGSYPTNAWAATAPPTTGWTPDDPESTRWEEKCQNY